MSCESSFLGTPPDAKADDDVKILSWMSYGLIFESDLADIEMFAETARKPGVRLTRLHREDFNLPPESNNEFASGAVVLWTGPEATRLGVLAEKVLKSVDAGLDDEEG